MRRIKKKRPDVKMIMISTVATIWNDNNKMILTNNNNKFK